MSETKTWIEMADRHPEDGQTVLMATEGGGATVWVATFYEGDEKNSWCFITGENNNEVIDELGMPRWMPIPSCPFPGGWDHDPELPGDFARDLYEETRNYLWNVNPRLKKLKWYRLLEATVEELRKQKK